MDFFEHQDLARKRSGRLVLLFIAAIICIVVALYLVGLFAMPILAGVAEAQSPDPSQQTIDIAFSWWSPLAAIFAVAVGGLLIGGGTGYKTAQLSGGGRVIAEELGGSLLTRDRADADGQKLLNVVEEMAIASGTPVPPVYLLENEKNINAFAAGFRPEDAVIGVTRGAVQQLSRDELQGVIAHEFSHILSGDMRLNMRLVAVLHGILLLGLTGGAILRGFYYASWAGASRRSSRDNGGGGIIIAIMVIGAALTAIGYIGVFFGNWIKAAVSRQREYLADASAVQFTRNPDGIAGALKAIGGSVGRAKLKSPNAPEASHMYFGAALASGLFATHPPLEERIRRIDPNWDGKFPKIKKPEPPPTPAKTAQPARAAINPQSALGAALALSLEPRQAVDAAGRMHHESIARARALIDRIPPIITDAAADPFGARAVVLALLIDKTPDGRKRQAALLFAEDPRLGQLVGRLARPVMDLPPELRLPILERSMQPLAHLSGPQVEQFERLVHRFIRIDDATDLFEWVVQRLVSLRLAAAAGRVSTGRVRYYALSQLDGPCSTLLTIMARAGSPNPDAQRRAFAAGAAVLDRVEVSLQPDAALDDLAPALDELDTTSARVKKNLLEACGAVLLSDRTVTPAEVELFRAVGASLGVPMPPLFGDLPGAPA